MQDSQSKQPKPGSRRTFFMGAATVGAVAAVVTALPHVGPSPVAAQEATPALPPAPDNGGGYSLSEHVKRYYRTAAA